ncbi:MAG: hypothetical protein VX438_08745, partial [Planctomycetota bacterium]|nr:hypothetical protein [Planctomycetota bacterium]
MKLEKLILGGVSCLFIFQLLGCQPSSPPQEDLKDQKTLAHSKPPSSVAAPSLKNAVGAADTNEEAGARKNGTKIVKKRFSSGSTDSFATKSFLGGEKRKTNLTRLIWDYALESQQIKPTVVIWLFDETASAKKLRDTVIAELKQTQTGTPSEIFESVVVGFSAAGL